MLAVAIVSLVYYGILILKEIRNRRQPRDYYAPVSLVTGQCGPNGCTEPQWGGSTSSSLDGSWQLPTTSGEPWIYKVRGREVGRINADGSRVGFVDGDPSWYPSGMPQALYSRQSPVEKVAANDKPTGVNVEELAKEKANSTTGITVNGQPVTEGTLRDKLSDSARARGLRDYSDTFRVVIVGNASDRKAWCKVAEPFIRESHGKAVVQEYEPGAWHVAAHMHAVKELAEYRNGEPFAYIQTNDDKNNTRGIMLTSMELGHALKQLRPEISPDFDPSKARAINNANTHWIIWASVIGVAIIGAVGYLTGRPSDA